MQPLRVFWPRKVAANGTIIGWLQEDTAVVAAVVEEEILPLEVQKRLNGNVKWEELKDGCQSFPQIIGKVQLTQDGSPTIQLKDNEVHGTRLFYIYYDRPSLYHIQFFSVSPLELDITAKAATDDDIVSSEELEKTETLFYQGRSPSKSCDLQRIANQLNASGVVHQALNTPESSFKLNHPQLMTPSMPHTTSNGLARLGTSITSALRSTCGVPISIFDSTTRLRDISATAQQLDVRLEQFSFFPSQMGLIRTRSRRNVAVFSAQYINFYNNLWLIFNDVVAGTAMGAILCENDKYFGNLLYKYSKMWTVQYINDVLVWLDNWPVGLKLNTELSRALCFGFIIMNDSWGYLLDASADYFPSLIFFIGISGRMGSTMILSLISDALSLLTMHIYMSYLAATFVCHTILATSGSLWNLFRGKRYNVLQKRLDKWDYSLDQLLLGTMLFTLVTFLSPTFVVYYVLFAASRLVIILLHASLETLIAFLNHFPLFVLMLRIKDPLRLPGGIVFVPKTAKENGSHQLLLRSVPISFSRIFFQHLLLWGRLSSHYHPLRLLRCVASASLINPIPRYSIRYSMLPAMDSGQSAKLKVA